MPTSRTDIEKNILVPSSMLVGIMFTKSSLINERPEWLEWGSIFLLVVTIFWCWRWLRLPKDKGK